MSLCSTTEPKYYLAHRSGFSPQGAPIPDHPTNTIKPAGKFCMSPFVSLPPVSPGIVYAVRKLLEYAPGSEPEARELCSRLWPKMDEDAVQIVLTHWSRTGETLSDSSHSTDTR